MHIRHPAIVRLLIFAITILAFARLTNCEFTWWDDQDTIHQNRRLNPPTWDTLDFYWTTAGEHLTMGLYVPVTYTLWSALAKIGQLDHPDAHGLTLNAAVFHTANVVIHALTAVLVFQLLLVLISLKNAELPRRIPEHISKRDARDLLFAAAAGAFVFALHPVQVESVGWVSGTKDLLCGFFSVGALLMYVRSSQFSRRRSLRYTEEPDFSPSDPALQRASKIGTLVLQHPTADQAHHRWPARWRYLLGLFLFCLGMLSKPTAVVVPLMAVTIGVFLLNRPVQKSIVSLIPWFVLMVPCLIWTKLVQPATWNSPLPLRTRPVVAVDAIAFYLWKLIWPIHLCIDYGHGPQAILDNHLIYFSWILPAAVIGFLWRDAQRYRPVIAAGLLFVLPLLPVLGFVGFEFQQISTTSDHYLYLPMLGVALLATWIFSQIQSPKKIPVTIAILIALGVRSVFQEPTWQDTRSLMHHALDVNPRSVVSSDVLGFVAGRDARRLVEAGHAEKAKPFFDESIAWYQRSVSLAPTSVPSIYNLALDYQAIGQENVGRKWMHHIVELQPQLPVGLRVDPIDLAHRLYDFGDVQGTIDYLDSVIRKNPGNMQAIVLRQRAIDRLQSTGKQALPLAQPGE